jgi:hypothetical protein
MLTPAEITLQITCKLLIQHDASMRSFESPHLRNIFLAFVIKSRGLDWVSEYRNDGYFILNGLSPQEELLGSISHDVHTPLSSLQRTLRDARRRIMSSIVQLQSLFAQVERTPL